MVQDRLFKRQLTATFLSLRTPIPTLRFTFDYVDDNSFRMALLIKRTNDPPPDQCTFSVWGLSRSTRESLTLLFDEVGKMQLSLRAGYENLKDLLFLGDVYKLEHKKLPTGSFRSDFTSGDGQRAFSDSTMNESFVANVPINTVRKLAETSLGLKPRADSEAAFAEALATSQQVNFENGFIAKGKTNETIVEVAAAVGLKWWIRNGSIVYVPKTRVTTDTAIVLNQKTGLVGEAEQLDNREVKFRALLNPNIFPGRQVIVQDRNLLPVKGTPHRVDTIEYKGDTHGRDWYATGLGRPSLVGV